jgi:hypothetical protein
MAKYNISLIRSDSLRASALPPARRQSLQRGEPPQRAASTLRLNFNPQFATILGQAVLS